MRIQWYMDGAALQNSDRFHYISDFGFVRLDIAYTVREDATVYAVVASNYQGEERTDAYIIVQGRCGQQLQSVRYFIVAFLLVVKVLTVEELLTLGNNIRQNEVEQGYFCS